MGEYIFEKNAADREFDRLKMIEAATDADTVSLLEQTGIAAGWNCIELGAGAGSIAEWMGRRVGPQGLILAIDKKTEYLDRLSGPPYRLVEGEFGSLAIDPGADLLHARYVLIHNTHAEEMLAKIVTVVRPGGYVLLEEPDFTSAMRLNPLADDPQQRVNHAICRMFLNAGLEPDYGLGLPQKAEKAGLRIVRTKARIHLSQGNQPISLLMAESALVLRKEYIGTGFATDQDIDRYVALAHDITHWSLYYSTVSVLGRVP